MEMASSAWAMSRAMRSRISMARKLGRVRKELCSCKYGYAYRDEHWALGSLKVCSVRAQRTGKLNLAPAW